MSENVLLILSLPVFVLLLAALWVVMKISRHSTFSFKLSGLGVKVELVSKRTEVSEDDERPYKDKA